MSSSTEGRLDLNSRVHSVISFRTTRNHDEPIFLVSREGTTFPVGEQLARQCSPYFDCLLGSHMSEAGKLPEPLSPLVASFSLAFVFGRDAKRKRDLMDLRFFGDMHCLDGIRHAFPL
jgi:hypothetical protein